MSVWWLAGQRTLSIPDFGRTNAAILAGAIGTIHRLASEVNLALYLVMAALDNGSGLQHGAKDPRQINRHAKAVMMIGVDRHRKHFPESQRYWAKKPAEGKTHNQAVRALGRHLARVIFQMLKRERRQKTKQLTSIVNETDRRRQTN